MKRRILIYSSLLSILVCVWAGCTVSGGNSPGKFSFFGAPEKPEPLTSAAMLDWVESKENQLLNEKTIDDMNYSSLYKPHAYMCLLEAGNHSGMNSSELEKIKSAYSGMEYFTFKISTAKTQEELLRYKAAGSDEYYRRLEYYSFKAQEDFALLAGKDSLKCKLFHFERTFGLAPILTFVLGFQGERKPEQDLTLVYNDRIFSNGIIKLHYGAETLNAIPELKIK